MATDDTSDDLTTPNGDPHSAPHGDSHGAPAETDGAHDDSATSSGASDGGTSDGGASDDDAASGGLTRAERIRFAIYAVLLAVGLGILTWQLIRDEPSKPLILGLFVASDDELRDASATAPIYWLGPDPLPTPTKITGALPGEKRTEITANLRGAVFYQSLDDSGAVRDEQSAPYATVYTRSIDGPTRYNINKTKRECAEGKCPGALTRITGRFGEAFIESNNSGGWMARIQRGNALVFVSAGKPLQPEPTLMLLRPFGDDASAIR